MRSLEDLDKQRSTKLLKVVSLAIGLTAVIIILYMSFQFYAQISANNIVDAQAYVFPFSMLRRYMSVMGMALLLANLIIDYRRNELKDGMNIFIYFLLGFSVVFALFVVPILINMVD